MPYMGALHPRPICLFDFKNLDTGKQKLLLYYCLKKVTTNTTRLVGYVHECS